MVAFWSWLFITHLAAIFLYSQYPEGVSMQGFVAWLITPIFAVITALGMRLASRRLVGEGWKVRNRRKWLRIGTILIPLLQLITTFSLILFSPNL